MSSPGATDAGGGGMPSPKTPTQTTMKSSSISKGGEGISPASSPASVLSPDSASELTPNSVPSSGASTPNRISKVYAETSLFYLPII